MPWKESDRMSERLELVALAERGGVTVSALAARFGVSRKTAYKWIKRHRELGPSGLTDRSRRPRTSPNQTSPEIETEVLKLRDRHPTWSGRKLHHRLKALGIAAPSPTTINRILHVHGRIDPVDSEQRLKPKRFEYDHPNDLWQMDFKSPVELVNGGFSQPFTVIDDHSRFALGLEACSNQKLLTVKHQLTRMFETYGLPWAILSDNGSPWSAQAYEGSYARLEVWLMRLDISPKHGRPYHPQTQGKDERFHRTIQAEVLQGRSFRNRHTLQRAFDPWRQIYNHERPHEALAMQTPATRYRASRRSMPTLLPPVEYDAGVEVRHVDSSGQFRFKRRKIRAGKAFIGEWVGLRATATDGLWQVLFSRFKIGQVDLRTISPHEFSHILRPRSGRSAASTSPQDG